MLECAAEVAMRSIVLVVNPCAGRGAGARLAPQIVTELRRGGVDAEMRLTSGPRHAIELVRDAVRAGAQQVAVAGGDGTTFEAVNGMLRAADPAARLGIIPIGTGNDFVKMLGLADWRDGCARIVADSSRQVDVGRCGSHFFANGIGVGFDAQVAHIANGIRRLSGNAVYAVALLRALAFDFRTPRVRIHHDSGVIEGRITLAAVANGRCYGGAFQIAPNASIDDGLFEVVVADALPRHRVIGLVPQVLKGTHLSHPAVRTARARRVRVEAEDAVMVHADGEILATAADQLDIELLPRALTLIA